MRSCHLHLDSHLALALLFLKCFQAICVQLLSSALHGTKQSASTKSKHCANCYRIVYIQMYSIWTLHKTCAKSCTSPIHINPLSFISGSAAMWATWLWKAWEGVPTGVQKFCKGDFFLNLACLFHWFLTWYTWHERMNKQPYARSIWSFQVMQSHKVWWLYVFCTFQSQSIKLPSKGTSKPRAHSTTLQRHKELLREKSRKVQQNGAKCVLVSAWFFRCCLVLVWAVIIRNVQVGA